MKHNEPQLGLLPPEPEHTVTPRIWMLAALAVLLVAGIAAVATLRHQGAASGQVYTPAAYAPSLSLTGMQLSEATNGTGGKATYVDGVIRNTGSKTLTSAAVQVTFQTTDGTAPQRETLPLALVRTREPYVDLQPISAAPIAPGDQREFRLIFDSVPAAWDVKPPDVRVVRAEVR